MLAFQLAYDSIKNGACDAALVCGTQLTLRPTAAMQFFKLNMLSPQGKCQTFDANGKAGKRRKVLDLKTLLLLGDGYVRSEGIVAVLLQRESVAHRMYAEIVHAKSNTDGFKEQGLCLRDIFYDTLLNVSTFRNHLPEWRYSSSIVERNLHRSRC